MFQVRGLLLAAALLAVVLMGLAAAVAQDDAADADDAVREVRAAVETDPTPNEGDSADDMAIWLHPTDLSLSTVIGTDKRGGLAVYDLDGRQLQYLEGGRPNNIDLRYNFPLGNEQAAIAVVSNRSGDKLMIFRVDPETRQIADIAAREIESEIDVYGLCLYHSATTGRYYAFAIGEDGEIQQWELSDDGAGRVDAALVREFAVESQAEGCVADDERGLLFVAEEDVAIWRFEAEPDRPADSVAVERIREDGPIDDDDIEGLTLYYATGGGGYLIASGQGNDEFVVFSRGDMPQYLGRFAIKASDTIDGVSNTDGIDVTNVALSAAFPEGMFVAQDGRNTDPDANQNFKLVSWAEIARQLDLISDTDWDPRAVGAANSAPDAADNG